MRDRVIPFDAIHNFRDFGGYDVGAEASVRTGRLYRSAHLAEATPADLQRLAALGIAVAADLRRPSERRFGPNRWPESAAPRLIVSDLGDVEDLPPHMRFLRDAEEITPEAVHGYMLATYARFPYEDRLIEVFAGAFRALGAREGPLLVQCAAGKDRTGLLCALILVTLGVDRTDVFADYALSNRPETIDGVVRQTALRYQQRIGREFQPDQLRPMVGVHVEYLQTALEKIDATSGSVAAYVRDVLGVGDDVVAAMRADLLAPAAD